MATFAIYSNFYQNCQIWQSFLLEMPNLANSKTNLSAANVVVLFIIDSKGYEPN